jgi:cytoskeletal protein CcmA (bactofilin family)
MGTGYVRNDVSNNIADENFVEASDLDGEFNAIVSAFNKTTGHTHDGTTAEGGPVSHLGPAQDVIATANTLEPKTDNTVDLGTTTKEYKDLFVDGTAHIDTLDIDENATITGTLDVTGAVTAGSGLGVTGDITVTGTVDTVDVATLKSDFDTLNTAAQVKTLYENNADTNAFTDADHTKLDGIEALADVTDTANVTAAGAVMDSELTSETDVKALDQSVVTTASPTFGGLTVNGNITVTGTVDGVDIAADSTKLAGIEALADVTDTTNVTAAGAVMDSELTDITAVKAIDQGLATTDSPTFVSVTTTGAAVFSDDVTVDTSVFHVDATLDRVGIGTASPSSTLHIVGDDIDDIQLHGATGDNKPGISWYTSAGVKVAGLDVNDNDMLIIDGDRSSNVTDPFIGLNIQNAATARVYDDSIRVGEYVTNPVSGSDSGEDGVWITKNGRITAGFVEGYPLGLNRINASTGNLAVCRMDGVNVGNLTYDGADLTLVNSSDIRLKENIEEYKDGWSVVKQLIPASYNWKVDKTKTTRIGFIAQWMQSVVPEAVKPLDDGNDNDYLGVSPQTLVPYLTSALKEAIERIEKLEREIRSLK